MTRTAAPSFSSIRLPMTSRRPVPLSPSTPLPLPGRPSASIPWRCTETIRFCVSVSAGAPVLSATTPNAQPLIPMFSSRAWRTSGCAGSPIRTQAWPGAPEISIPPTVTREAWIETTSPEPVPRSSGFGGGPQRSSDSGRSMTRSST